MPENETQENQENQNQAPTAEAVGEALSLDQIKAQLEEERQAKAALEQATADKDARIAELESALSEAKQQSEANAFDLATLKETTADAVAHYLDMAKALNPQVPEGIITGESIAQIDASVEKGKATVEAVKATMQAEAAATKVPAGAPTRGLISTEGMSPREKIAAGISRQSRE